MIQSTEASNAIEKIHAPRARIEALVAEKTTPKNRSEQEIAGYRDVLGLIHANQTNIPFEPRYVEQLHGNLYRYVGDTTAGHWKRLEPSRGRTPRRNQGRAVHPGLGGRHA
jgi:hypothetical protein